MNVGYFLNGFDGIKGAELERKGRGLSFPFLEARLAAAHPHGGAGRV